MAGFKDKSWCYWGVNGICANTKCDRILTPELHKEAVAWWGNSNFPLQTVDLQTKDCGAKLKEGNYGFYRN